LNALNSESIGVVGLGYVGLALVNALCKSGREVYGLDASKSRVNEIRAGKSSNESISDTELVEYQTRGLLQVSDEPISLKNCEVVLIAVPTPLDENGKPDLRLLVKACEDIAPHLKNGALVINESTSFPGTLRDLVVPTIQKTAREISLEFGCSPERINPGDLKFGIENTPRVVSGLDESAKVRTRNFYKSFVREVFLADSPEIAEMSKLLENSYRLVNIAFINEISDYCSRKGIPIRAVIEAAQTKPFGFSPFTPSLGIGGHCIPVDPEYLLEDASGIDAELRILKSASLSNSLRGESICELIERDKGSLAGKRVLIVGITYKANIADDRESPAEELVLAIQERNASVEWFDPLIDSWSHAIRGKLEEGRYDLVVVSSLHDVINKELLLDLQIPIFDFSGKLPKSNLVVSI